MQNLVIKLDMERFEKNLANLRHNSKWSIIFCTVLKVFPLERRFTLYVRNSKPTTLFWDIFPFSFCMLDELTLTVWRKEIIQTSVLKFVKKWIEKHVFFEINSKWLHHVNLFITVKQHVGSEASIVGQAIAHFTLITSEDNHTVCFIQNNITWLDMVKCWNTSLYW